MAKLSEAEITKLFKPSRKHPNRIHGREGKTTEFKQSYNHAGMARYFKTMASFANTEGGYIIFGIGDSPREFIGLTKKSRKQFDNIKIEEFTNNLNEYFQPEILWEHTLFEFRGKEFGIIYTYQLENKPCICTRNFDGDDERSTLKEGDIYYRYRARSERIKYSELNQIIINREKKLTKLWMQLIENTGKIGIENAALLDLNKGILSEQHTKIIVDEKIIDKLKFIKEGHFAETGGDPTLKLIGDIEGITAANVILNPSPTSKLKAIEPEDIITAFLSDGDVESPSEYIKVSFNCSSGFQPIYYFMNLANISNSDLIDYINNDKRHSKTISIIKERLEGRREQYIKLKDTGTDAYIGKKKYLELWKKFEIGNVDFENLQESEIVWLLISFFSIEDSFLLEHSKDIKKMLNIIYNKYFIRASGKVAGNFRKVICRLDEVLYFEASEDTI